MTPPKVIYLQWYDVDGEEAIDEEVTWCLDQINDTDVAYVLASRIKELEAEVAGLEELIASFERGRIT
jgi:hypothetical protein